jgi:hypothetical protein
MGDAESEEIMAVAFVPARISWRTLLARASTMPGYRQQSGVFVPRTQPL